MNIVPSYTPGPWYLRKINIPGMKGCFVEAPRKQSMPYALDVCGDDYTGYGDDEQREINMRLISAAPDLIEALKGMTTGGCFCQVGIGNPMCPSHSKECIAARAAIKKATGEE